LVEGFSTTCEDSTLLSLALTGVTSTRKKRERFFCGARAGFVSVALPLGDKRMRLAVSWCFFLSGLSGLCFEVVWTRALERVFGASSLAVSSVLTVYMAGLALGSYWGGRLADRVKRPVRAYALCEAGIAALGLAVLLWVEGYPPVYRALFSWWYGASFWLFSLARLAMAFVALLGPTLLMGATLPLLSRFLAQEAEERGGLGPGEFAAGVSRLYALNLVGACVGAFFCGFWLLPALGIFYATLAAASINLSLPLLLWLGARSRRQSPEQDELRALLQQAEQQAEAEHAVEVAPVAEGARRAVVVGAAFSGALSMLYQVLWTRALAIILGASTYAFSLIVGSFLLGLFLGSALAARLLRRLASPLRVLGLVHLGIALSTQITAQVFDGLPRVYLALAAPHEGSSFGAVMFGGTLLTVAALLIPTTLLGAIFSLTLRAVERPGQDSARHVGSLYAANTLGAIVGSFAGGFLLLPLVGLERGLSSAALASSGLAALSFWLAGSKERRAALVAPLSAVLLALLLPRWDVGRLNEGLFRPVLAREAAEEGEYQAPHAISFYQDGVSATVAVEDLGDEVFALKVNGKVDASSSTDMPTQILAGALPMALHAEAEQRPLKVAVVGFGSGVTLGSALQLATQSLDVIEIEPAVVEAARLFSRWNHQVHDDPRLRTRHEDGRNFLLSTEERYDVIISEPSNPWMAGVANLFTSEYFHGARERLARGGVFLQWVQLYEMRTETVQLIMRTFAEEFPEGHVFCAYPHSPDLFLVAAPDGLSLDAERLARVFAAKAAAEEFARAGLRSPEDLLARLVMGPKALRTFAGEGPRNTDDNGLLAFRAPRDLLRAGVEESASTGFYQEFFGAREEDFFAEKLIAGREGRASARMARALARAGRLRAALLYADASEGRPTGSGTLAAPFPEGAAPQRWPEAERARVSVALFSGPHQETVAVPDDIARRPPPPPEPFQPRPPNDDLRAHLDALVSSAKRREAALSPEDELERALAWQAPFEAAEALKTFFAETPSADALRGMLAYKVGLRSDAERRLRAAQRKAPPGAPWLVAALYYLARAEFDRGEPLRADDIADLYLEQATQGYGALLKARLSP
jgi:spermidine synthase